jgi:hypothetical protein
LARVSAVNYRETVWSELFPGSRHTVTCLQPAVLATESSLELAAAQRRRTVWRFDGGAGSDEQVIWLLNRGYHLVGKGLSNRRAEVLARQVRRWDAYPNYCLGTVPAPIDYGHPVQVFVKRRFKKDKFLHSYYLTTLKVPSKGYFMSLYDNRGGAEVEQFRSDKSGLHLATRQKSGFFAQQGVILLTDLAHNLLADFRHHALAYTRFHDYGQKRIVNNLLNIPGKLIFEAGILKQVELLSTHENAKEMRSCLEKFCSGE